MGTVVGKWRLNLIISLFVILTMIYLVNGFFYGIQTDEAGYIKDEGDVNLDDNLTKVGKNQGTGFLDVLFGIGDYLSFGNVDNGYARLILNIFTSCCWICIGYISYTFVKEWVPLT